MIRIKNASLAKHLSLDLPYSVFGEKLAQFLLKKDYLGKVAVAGEKPSQKLLNIGLKYRNKRPAISQARQISKPGRRVYLKVGEMPAHRRRGPGMVVISTSKGLMSLEEARKAKIGGELLCEIW